MDPVVAAITVLSLAGLISPCFFVGWRRARRDARELRLERSRLLAERKTLLERSDRLTAAETELEGVHKELRQVRASRDHEHLEKALDESGGRNAKLRQQNEELEKALVKTSYDLEYTRALGKRYQHDSIDRLKLLDKILEGAGSGVDADSIALGRQQLVFLLESLELNLAKDICEHVKSSATERKESFNLNKLVTRLVDTFREQDKQGRISIKTETTEAWMWGKWLHVELLLSNLITNALNHGSRDGAIEVDLRQEGDNAIIEVENEGPPFDPAKVADEGNSTTKSRFGLFFVRQVVAGFDGKCEWRPTRRIRGAGKNQKEVVGMKAIVTLPLMPARSPEKKGVPESAASSR